MGGEAADMTSIAVCASLSVSRFFQAHEREDDASEQNVVSLGEETKPNINFALEPAVGYPEGWL